MIEATRVLKRLFEANVNMEHYWFFPKTKMVPVELEIYSNLRQQADKE